MKSAKTIRKTLANTEMYAAIIIKHDGVIQYSYHQYNYITIVLVSHEQLVGVCVYNYNYIIMYMRV